MCETHFPSYTEKLEYSVGTSLVTQWLRLQAANAGGLGSIPGQEARSHVPQLKIPLGNKWQLQGREYTSQTPFEVSLSAPPPLPLMLNVRISW